MKILTNASSNNENWNGDCDYALIEIKSPEHYLRLINKAQEIKESIDGFFKIEAFDYSITWFSDYDEITEVVDKDGKNALEQINGYNYDGFVVLPDDFELPEDVEQRTDCDSVNIQENKIGWSCYVKYTNTEITSGWIPKTFLEENTNG